MFPEGKNGWLHSMNRKPNLLYSINADQTLNYHHDERMSSWGGSVPWQNTRLSSRTIICDPSTKWQIKWSTPCTTSISTWLLMLTSTFTRVRVPRKWSTVARLGRQLPSPNFPILIQFKSVSEFLWVRNFFPPFNFSLTDEMWRASHYSVVTSMESALTNCILSFSQFSPSRPGAAMPLTW